MARIWRMSRIVANVAVATVSAVAAYGLVVLPSPVPAEALSCAAPDWSWAGNYDIHTNAVSGAKAGIEYVNEQLCTTTGGTDFSSFWVAVVGLHSADTDGWNIYQVGVDKCRGNQCVSGVPVNQSYYFWAYGRMSSAACGAAIPPEPHLAPLGNAGSGTKTYKVVKEYTPGAGWFYNTYIGSGKQSTQTASSLETCWGGVDAVDVANEVYSPNTQSGGSVSNPQTYSSVYWYNGASWSAITGPQGGNCDTVDLSTMRCRWQQFDPSKWDSWDTRWP